MSRRPSRRRRGRPSGSCAGCASSSRRSARRSGRGDRRPADEHRRAPPWALGLARADHVRAALRIHRLCACCPLKALAHERAHDRSAFGVLVLVFLHGAGVEGLEQTQPVLLAATVFGLSTDYAVFLLSRIKEAHDRGGERRLPLPGVSSGRAASSRPPRSSSASLSARSRHRGSSSCRSSVSARRPRSRSTRPS